MKKKKFNAFTLVELLAVIVILAIILVIAVPKITKVIEQSKKGALESSAKLIAGSLETKYKEELALGTDEISTSTSKTCPASMYDSTLYSCTYILDSNTGKATVSLIGKAGAKFEKLGVDSTTTEATSYKLGESITITFDSQGGSAVESKTLTSGDAYGTLANPTKSGVTFKGWYTDTTGGTKVASTDIAKSSITLYAHYAESVEFSSSWKTTINSKIVGSLTIVSQGASSNIKTIKFYDNTDNIYDTTGKTFIANVSTTGETIKAYGAVDSTDSTKIDIDIVGDKLIAFPTDSSKLFYNLTNLNSLNFNNSITTSNVTNMRNMFYYCTSLTNLDLSNFDTSNVTHMEDMFYACSSLTSLDLSNFDTRNVTHMQAMFQYCFALTSLDVSNFDTSNVMYMSYMFYGCTLLANLDLSEFNTSNVTNMQAMFQYCFALTSLDVSNFDTSKVTNMSNMFCMLASNTSTRINGVSYSGKTNGANHLTEIKGLNNFNTSNVTNMSDMFNSCNLLTNLDISAFDTSNVTNMEDMFKDCNKLENLDVSSFDTRNVTDMGYMFNYCSSLTSLNLNSFETSNVTDMSSMFSGCSLLTNLDISSFDTSNVTSMSYMFWGCSNLTSLDVSSFDTSKVTNMSSMFSHTGYNSTVFTLDVSNFDTSKVTDMSYMFYYTGYSSTIFTLNVNNFDTSSVTYMTSMFDNTGYNSTVFTLDVSNFNTSNVSDMSNMFNRTGYSNKSFTLDVSSFNTSNVTNMLQMFCKTGYNSTVFTLDVSNFDTSKVTSMYAMFSWTGYNSAKFNTEITILNPNVTNYFGMFECTAIKSGSQITVNYTTDTLTLATNMVATKSSSSNVVLASSPISAITPNITTANIVSSGSGYPNTIMTLASTDSNLVVTSFKLNGTTVKGNTFKMPETTPTISDVTTVEMYVVESTHGPYENSIDNVVYGEKTFTGAKSLTVTLDYQTESVSYDWIYLYGTSYTSNKYGGTTRKTETIEIPGDYIKIVFRTDSSGNNYYGFKATVIPNY